VSRRIINVGSAPLAGDGEQLRDALIKVNDNFEEIYVVVENINIPTDISQLTDNQGLLADSTDGGSSSSVFDEDLTINGGSASTIYNESLTLNGGGA
jgi:hypothetical protein